MRRRSILLTLASCIPLLLLAVGYLYVSLSQQQQAMAQNAKSSALQLASHVSAEFRSNIRLLELLSEAIVLDPPSPQLDKFQELASRFLRRMPAWDRIILNGSNDQQLINTAVPYGGALPKTVMPDERKAVFASKKPLIGDVRGPGPLVTDGIPRVRIRVPAIRGGDVVYDLTAVFKVEGLSELLQSAVAEGWRPTLIDSKGTVAASPASPSVVGKAMTEAGAEAREHATSGLYAMTAGDGVPLMTAFAVVEETGWSVHIGIPLSSYQEPITRAYWSSGIVALLALTLSAAFIVLLRREMVESAALAAASERSARLEALGRVAGGVAHDMNNVLMVVMSGVELVRRRANNPTIDKFLDAMHAAADRGRAITSDLLVFARGGTGEKTIIDVPTHVKSLETLLRQALRGDVQLEVKAVDDILYAKLDVTQLDLALLNLAANARDAMPSGGRITVTVGRDGRSAGSEAKQVKIAVEDTGEGMSPEVQRHVFEPFFTTKPAGKGTGLGLSQVHGFVKSTGGSVNLTSTPGKGTIVTLLLPITTELPTEASQPSPPADVASRKVLLVEDNAEVRAVAAGHLRELGHEVLEASDANEALDQLGQAHVDIVVTDMVMPGTFDGLALAKRLRDSKPDLPVILVSGYSDAANAAREAGFQLLPKPYDVSVLSEMISSVLVACREPTKPSAFSLD